VNVSDSPSPKKRSLMPSSPLRRTLRATGHHLAPVVQVGKEGVTEAVLRQVDRALLDHELIKVKVGTETPEDRFLTAEALLGGAEGSHLAQILGRTMLLYRRHPEKPRFEPLPASVVAARQRNARPEPRARSTRAERTGRPARGGRPERTERAGRPERSGRSEKSGRFERPGRPERTGRPERSARPERTGRPERTSSPGRSNRPERTRKPGRPPRTERTGKPDRPGRTGRSDRPPARRR
jgi:RNA-binding protein